MSTRDETFDMRINIESYNYGDDWSTTVTVTFPAYGSQSAITKDYHDEFESDAIRKAMKDIRAFLKEPDAWIAEYVETSSESGRKLVYAKEQLAEYTQELERHQRYVQQYEELKEKYTQEVRRLEETL